MDSLTDLAIRIHRHNIPTDVVVSAGIGDRDPLSTIQSTDLDQVRLQYGTGWETYTGGMKVVEELGAGANGTTFMTCRSTTNCMAMKLQKVKNILYFRNEIAMQIRMSKLGLCPHIISYKTYTYGRDTIGVILMDRINGTLSSLLEYKLSRDQLNVILGWLMDILHGLSSHRIVHGDMHYRNIGYVFTTDVYGRHTIRLQLIDMGWSSMQPKHEFMHLELLQLMRCTDKYFEPDMYPTNRTYVRKYLKNVYMNMYGEIQFPDVEDMWEAVSDIYRGFWKKFIRTNRTGSRAHVRKVPNT
jgi:tRNA A-37 threonylcarbamoyl transferase component Bud32